MELGGTFQPKKWIAGTFMTPLLAKGIYGKTFREEQSVREMSS
jgi:hypothetical protein